MNRRHVMSAVLLVGAVLATSVAVWAATQTEIGWDVIGGGGGESISDGITVEDTLGQHVVGVSQGGGIRLEAGFWPGADVSEPGPSPTGDRPTATATRTVDPVASATPTATRTESATTPTATPTDGPGPTVTATPTTGPQDHKLVLPVIVKDR